MQIHFVWLCVYSMVHLPCEVLCLSPSVCSSQWMLEQTIGNLGEEIKQPSNPFANPSQHGIWHVQVNALKAMIPDLTSDRTDTNSLSHSARDPKDGFILLCVQEEVLGSL
jgi:hypothetical protein